MIEPSCFDLSLQAHRNAAIDLAQELERRSIEGELAKRLRAAPALSWPQSEAAGLNTATTGCLAAMLSAGVGMTLVISPLVGFRGTIGGLMQFVNPWPAHLVMVY